MASNKKLFSALSALTLGSLIVGKVALKADIAHAGSHSSSAPTTDKGCSGDKKCGGDKSCGGEKGCGGEHDDEATDDHEVEGEE